MNHALAQLRAIYDGPDTSHTQHLCTVLERPVKAVRDPRTNWDYLSYTETSHNTDYVAALVRRAERKGMTLAEYAGTDD